MAVRRAPPPGPGGPRTRPDAPRSAPNTATLGCPARQTDIVRLSRLIVLPLALLVSGCMSSATPVAPSSPGSATAPAATRSPPRPGAWDWPSYHRDPAHTGLAAAAPPAGPLSIAWIRQLD